MLYCSPYLVQNVYVWFLSINIISPLLGKMIYIFHIIYFVYTHVCIYIKFFTLFSACFPANNKLYKIINKNTIKLSYSCMSNIKQSIANHNKAILSKEKIKEEQIKLCNCRNRTQLSSKRSRIPGHRHTDQHNEGIT